MKNKTIDICVFGATGFTGRLVSEYLATQADAGKISWALAGRNKQKLEQVREALSGKAKPEIIVADVANYESLSEMAAVSKVIITTVGPYTRYGEPLVKACIEKQCDYVDLVGEPNFVDEMRYRHHEKAKEAGVKIINACGFDSIPHDLGVLFTINKLREKFSAEEQKYLQIDCEGFVSTNAKFSGGTWHSAIAAMSEMLAHRKRKKLWQEEGYTGKELHDSKRKIKSGFQLIFYNMNFSKWALPMPTIDPEIVRRSAQLRSDYGMRFCYRHYVLMEKFWQLPLLIAGVSAVFILAQFRLGREKLAKVIEPGDGPSAEVRASSWFTVDFFAKAGKQKIHTRVSGGDPGYTETSKMLAESALCLALQRQQCPEVFGITTSAAGMGEILIERLQKAGISFEIL